MAQEKHYEDFISFMKNNSAKKTLAYGLDVEYSKQMRKGSSSTILRNTGETQSVIPKDSYSFSSFNSTRQFIQLEKSFRSQIDKNPGYFGDQSHYILQEKMKTSAELILSYCPENISLQITNEGSIFYTFTKKGYSIYIQHFLIDEYDDSDEAILSIFRGDDNLLNYGGNLSSVFSELSKFIVPNTYTVLEQV